MNIITKMRRRLLLEEIGRLERHAEFISPFFCGETQYPIKLKENETKLKKAKQKLKRLGHE